MALGWLAIGWWCDGLRSDSCWSSSDQCDAKWRRFLLNLRLSSILMVTCVMDFFTGDQDFEITGQISATPVQVESGAVVCLASLLLCTNHVEFT